jgi:periplasmic protein CpxP/Spy
MIKKRVFLIVGAVVLTAALTACGIRNPSAEQIADRIGHKLDLNDFQKTKLEILKEKLLALRESTKIQRAADKKEIIELLTRPTLDRGRTEQLVLDHLHSLESNAPQMVAVFGDFYDQLTPEQQKILREHIVDHMDQHHFNH